MTSAQGLASPGPLGSNQRLVPRISSDRSRLTSGTTWANASLTEGARGELDDVEGGRRRSPQPGTQVVVLANAHLTLRPGRTTFVRLTLTAADKALRTRFHKLASRLAIVDRSTDGRTVMLADPITFR